MMEDTVTLERVETRSSSIAMNEEAVSNLRLGYATSGLWQTDRRIRDVKRSEFRIQRAANQRFVYTGDWDEPAEHAKTYVIVTPNGLVPVGSVLVGSVLMKTSESVVENVNKELQRGAFAREYGTRLGSLRVEADNENIEINEDSYSDFWRFIEYAAPKTYASVMLSPRGTFRAVWRTGPDNHIGLHFTGGGNVNYVIFKSKPNDDEIIREAGACTFTDVLSLIERYGLKSLV